MGLADFGISVNGGGPQTGGIDVPGASTIDFVPVSTAGWLRARWEIPDYPEGWATPAGWTLDGSSGVIYSTAIPQPPQITLEAASMRWGVWMPRLRVNEQIDTDQTVIDGLLCDTNAFSVLSPSGLRDIGAREEEHFTTSTTRIKKWLRSYQRNLRTIESASLATTNGDAPAPVADEVETTDATPTPIFDPITLDADKAYTIDIAAECIQAGASKKKRFDIRREFLNDGGVVTDGTQTDLVSSSPLGGSLAASIAIARTGTTVQPKVTGVASTTLRWYGILQVTKVGALTGSVPSAPTAISPNNGSDAGGTSVQITVPSSTGLIGAKVGGVALTGFTIDDATHVSGTTGAHAAGASDVVVTNAFGDSAALVGGYTYNGVFDPTTDALTSFFRDYGGSPWAGTASAGTSGSRTLTEATNAPAVGTALNGAGTAPASFDGLNDQLLSDGTVADYVDVDGFGGWVLVNIAAITTDNDTDNQQINNQTLWAQTDGYQAVYLRSNGGSPLVGFTMYDGTLPYKKTTRAIATGTWVLVHWRYTNGTGIQIGTNGTWSAAVASNNLDAGALASVVVFGRNYNSSAFLQYDWADGGTWDRAVLDADITNVKAYVNARYGLAL